MYAWTVLFMRSEKRQPIPGLGKRPCPGESGLQFHCRQQFPHLPHQLRGFPGHGGIALDRHIHFVVFAACENPPVVGAAHIQVRARRFPEQMVFHDAQSRDRLGNQGVAAAIAGDALPQVLLRFVPGGNDQMFAAQAQITLNVDVDVLRSFFPTAYRGPIEYLNPAADKITQDGMGQPVRIDLRRLAVSRASGAWIPKRSWTLFPLQRTYRKAVLASELAFGANAPGVIPVAGQIQALHAPETDLSFEAAAIPARTSIACSQAR